MSDALIAKMRAGITLPVYRELIDEIADEISALREELDRLRAALHKHAVSQRSGMSDIFDCRECGTDWVPLAGQSEHHRDGCLAALGERSGERE